jgi:hypothetical protein
MRRSENLKAVMVTTQNIFSQVEAETEKVRFSIQELSNLQTEIQVFVEELNSMKVCH